MNNIVTIIVGLLVASVGLLSSWSIHMFLSREVDPFTYSCDSEVSEKCKTIHKVHGQVTEDKMCVLLEGDKKICSTRKLDNDFANAILKDPCKTFSILLVKPIKGGIYTEPEDLVNNFYIETCIDE